MRSFDEARFGSNSEVAVFSRHLRLIPNADSARTLDELNDPGVSGLTSAYHFRSTPMNRRRAVEVKARAKGFRQLYDWVSDRDILIVRADRSEPLVVLPLKLAAEIAAKAGAQ